MLEDSKSENSWTNVKLINYPVSGGEKNKQKNKKEIKKKKNPGLKQLIWMYWISMREIQLQTGKKHRVNIFA